MKAFYSTVGLGRLCGLFGKSRQAFYEQQRYQERQHWQTALVLDLVREQRQRLPGVGGRKLLHLLRPVWQAHGIHLGRDAFFKLLNANKLLIHTRRSRMVTTQSRHRFRRYPNRARDLRVQGCEQLWVSDITYIRIRNHFAYLILITDAHSRRIMAGQLSPTLGAAFCVQALQTALGRRAYPEQALMHHSDRGIQYCCDAYIEALEKHPVTISMTEQGDPYENALAERMNGILKTEFAVDQVYPSFQAAHDHIQAAIAAYNYHRPHGSCDYKTPHEAHTLNQVLAKRWKPKKFVKAQPDQKIESQV